MDQQNAPEDAARNRHTRGRQSRRRTGRERPRAGDGLFGPNVVRAEGCIPTYEILTEEGLELIEENAETILQEVGVDFRGDPEALALWREAGAQVTDERVRIPRGLARELIKTAPAEFIQHARNPDKSVVLGKRHIVLAPGYGAPFVTDLDRGRRYATIEDFRNFARLAYVTPYLQHAGGTLCEPVDLPVSKRHLDMLYGHIRLSDKPFMGSVTAPERAADSVEMAKIVFGEGFVAENTVLLSLINVNSPLVLDATMLGALKVYARSNQATIITPFILQGAMSPVTGAGTLAQLYAEVLAGLAFTQLVRPGAPVVFGSFGCTISMRSGAPTFGTPESAIILFAAAQLARRLGVPFRSGGGPSASIIPDAQAGYEAANGLFTTLLAGVNFCLHAAGLIEGGLAMSYEKFILDADQCGMLLKGARGLDLSGNGQAMDTIREVGPGNHYLGAAHTLSNCEDAVYESFISESKAYEQWDAEGRSDAAQRANKMWKKLLAEYEPPPLDPATDEALKDYMARRKAELPDRFE